MPPRVKKMATAACSNTLNMDIDDIVLRVHSMEVDLQVQDAVVSLLSPVLGCGTTADNQPLTKKSAALVAQKVVPIAVPLAQASLKAISKHATSDSGAKSTVLPIKNSQARLKKLLCRRRVVVNILPSHVQCSVQW